MDIPEFKLPPQERLKASPNPSYFRWRAEVLELQAGAAVLTGSRKATDVANRYETRGVLEYKSNRHTESDLESTEYTASILLRMADARMEQMDEGWRVLLHEAQGVTEWSVVAVEWPFGFGRFPLARINRTTYAMVGEVE